MDPIQEKEAVADKGVSWGVGHFPAVLVTVEENTKARDSPRSGGA